MREYHYWIYAKSEEGKPFLVYGCPASKGESTCREIGIEMLTGLDFVIKKFPTRDISTASRMTKGGRLKETGNLMESTKRLGHGKSASRYRKERQSAWGL